MGHLRPPRGLFASRVRQNAYFVCSKDAHKERARAEPGKTVKKEPAREARDGRISGSGGQNRESVRRRTRGRTPRSESWPSRRGTEKRGDAGDRSAQNEAAPRFYAWLPLILALDGAQPATVTARLRGLGFRWSRVPRHWEGLARYEDASRAAEELGGTLRRVGPPGTDQGASKAEGRTAPGERATPEHAEAAGPEPLTTPAE